MLVTSQEDDQGIDQPIAGRKANFTVSDISKALLNFRTHIQRRQAQFRREDEKNIIYTHSKDFYTQFLAVSIFAFQRLPSLFSTVRSLEKKAKAVLPVI